MKNYILICSVVIAVAVILLTTCSSKKSDHDYEKVSMHAAAEILPSISVKAVPVVSGLTSPVGMAVANDGSNRLFVIEQQGRIRIIKNGILQVQPFLDVSSKIDKLSFAYSEKGLLGLAFHPQFKSNGRFYIYYSAPTSNNLSDHKSVVAEYRVGTPNADVAQDNGQVILEFEQPESNHNGGMLAFGPDGFLYIGSGDGGGAGDRHGESGNGQNLNTLLGKILRIDVDSRKPYAIPDDNPFKNKSARGEIFAYGLRNPWRFSFDRKTGKLFCGDVGQNKYEEVDIIESGKNYGWRIMEGNHCYNPEDCEDDGLTLPIYEYPHSVGISITGGYVYRGENKTELSGCYVYGDYNGKLFCLKEENAKWQNYQLTIEGKKSNDLNCKINSFGEDEQGAIYIITQKLSGPRDKSGVIYKIE